MSSTPSPALNPALWNSCEIGPYVWPPEPGEGGVKIAVVTAIDVDNQKPKGKDPAKSTTKGRKVAKIKLDFSFTTRVWDKGNEARLAWDPSGVNSGKAWDLRAVEPNARGVDHVLITQASALTITGDMCTFSLDADGWSEPKPAAVGGAKTPAKAVPANAKIVMGKDLPDLPGIPLGEIQPTGLDGPDQPDAEP